MYNRLKKLIEQRYYESADVAKEKVTVLYSYDKLTTEEYNELMGLIDEVYGNQEGN